MTILKEEVLCKGIRFSFQIEDTEVGRVYLYIMTNDFHEKPFGFIEDVEIKEEYREQGIWSQLKEELISLAKIEGCYKLLANSRFSRTNVHKIYQHMGFKKHGFEFRIDL